MHGERLAHEDGGEEDDDEKNREGSPFRARDLGNFRNHRQGQYGSQRTDIDVEVRSRCCGTRIGCWPCMGRL